MRSTHHHGEASLQLLELAGPTSPHSRLWASQKTIARQTIIVEELVQVLASE